MAMFYYDIKYPYLCYPFTESDGTGWWMYSVPVARLAEMYTARLGKGPRSFFDCGAATGELIRQATDMGLNAHGVDIRQYPAISHVQQQFFNRGQIKIKSILECKPIRADLAYCNGTLTYMNEQTLPLALSRFKNVRMLIAIHNTTEDVHAAAAMGDRLSYREPRLIRSNDWWMRKFRDSGFDVDYDEKYRCFCAIPIKRKTK